MTRCFRPPEGEGDCACAARFGEDCPYEDLSPELSVTPVPVAPAGACDLDDDTCESCQ